MSISVKWCIALMVLAGISLAVGEFAYSATMHNSGTGNGSLLSNLVNGGNPADVSTDPYPQWNTSDWIHIDTIADHMVYDRFSITGTTSAPEGTRLHAEIYASVFCPNATRVINETIIVKKGEPHNNRWSVPVDGSRFKPDEYIVLVYPEHMRNSSVSALFNMLNPSTPWIHVYPVHNLKVGDTLEVSGLTSIEAGKTVDIEMLRSTFSPVPPACFSSHKRTGLSGSVTIIATGNGFSSWSFNESLENFCPDEYILTARDNETSDAILFNVLKE